MDSQTKAIATRVSLEDYAAIQQEAKELFVTVSEWLQLKLIDCEIAKTEAEEWKQKNDALVKENQYLKDQVDHWVSKFLKIDSECSNYSNYNDKLERLLNSYDKNWEREYRNLFG